MKLTNKNLKRVLLVFISIVFTTSINGQSTDANETGREQTHTFKPHKAFRQLPEQYWVDIVTSRPETYVEDGNGNVKLYSAEALAWLCSVTNGLNGQEADDFAGRTVSLENDVDISAAIWTSIASVYENPEPPAPGKSSSNRDDEHLFSGIFKGNGHVINGMATNEGLFADVLEGTIEGVILKNAFAIGTKQGLLFNRSYFSMIDRCWLDGEFYVTEPMDKVCFGNEAIGSTVSNSIFRSALVDVSSGANTDGVSCGFVADASGASEISNCAIVIDSVSYPMDAPIVVDNWIADVRNCYSYLGAFKYYDSWPGIYYNRSGIVGINYSIVENCYYNWLDPEQYHELVNMPAIFEGEMTDVVMYDWMGDEWLLQAPVSFGAIETNSLVKALNLWVDHQNNSSLFSEWEIDESLLPHGLPVLSYFNNPESVEEEMSSNSLYVYPNPVTYQLIVAGKGMRQVELFNVMGQSVYSARYEAADRATLDVSTLDEGLYFVRVTDTDGKCDMTKVIVRR